MKYLRKRFSVVMATDAETRKKWDALDWGNYDTHRRDTGFSEKETEISKTPETQKG